MVNNYKPTELFGGAITANIPENFADVSNIRQVPDNQEVYLSTTGFTSLTIDLCERVSHAPTDVSALEYHFSDIVTEGDDAAKIHATDANLSLPNFPNVPVLTLLARTTPPPPPPPAAQKGGGPARRNAPAHVVILLALIRLEQQMTDVLVSLNVPHVPEAPEAAAAGEEGGEEADFESGKFGTAVEEGKEVLGEVLKTLKVRDWGLFGPGG